MHILEVRKVGQNEATVVLEAANRGELDSHDARSMAEQAANDAGLARPGLSDQGGPYPVDAKGVCSEELQQGKTAVHAYRRDFRFLSV